MERHNQVLFETANNRKRSLPDQIFTNLYIYFMESFEQAFTDKDVQIVLRAMGRDLRLELLRLVIDRNATVNKRTSHYYYSFDDHEENGFGFVLILFDRNRALKAQEQEVSLIASILATNAFSRLYSSTNDSINSIYTPNAEQRKIFSLTPLDKNFIRAHYSDHIKSGLSRDETARRIARELFTNMETTIKQPN